MRLILLFIGSLLLLKCSSTISAQDAAGVDYVEVSQKMLRAIKEGKSTSEYQKIISESTELSLRDQLKTDEQKIAFWVNIYNAYIQIKLREKPELYEKRSQFFNKKFIDIAGRTLSFGNIEHGIIRGSEWAYGLGIIGNPFAPRYQKRLCPKKEESRVHFALNCGAKSCPPVAIYDPEILNEQLDYMSKKFLSENTTYDKQENKVKTTTLFSWFRGDFGGKKGIKKMLYHYNVIPNTDVKLSFGDYDWTLYLDNFIEIPESTVSKS